MLLPAPDEPTTATTSPGSTERSRSARTVTSGRDAYANETCDHSMRPVTSLGTRPPALGMPGSRSRISKMRSAAPAARMKSAHKSPSAPSEKATTMV